MNRTRCRSLALAAWLCAAAPVVAEGPGGLWLNPVPGPDTVARPDPAPAGRVEMDLLRLFGGGALEWGNNRFAVPFNAETWRLDSRRSLLVNALAIEWQHSLNAANSLTLSARRDSLYRGPESPGLSTGPGQASSGRTATLSWNSLLGSDSRLSGRLYAGDEEAKASSNGDRRYFGMHLEGLRVVARPRAVRQLALAAQQRRGTRQRRVGRCVAAARKFLALRGRLELAGKPKLGCTRRGQLPAGRRQCGGRRIRPHATLFQHALRFPLNAGRLGARLVALGQVML